MRRRRRRGEITHFRAANSRPSAMFRSRPRDARSEPCRGRQTQKVYTTNPLIQICTTNPLILSTRGRTTYTPPILIWAAEGHPGRTLYESPERERALGSESQPLRDSKAWPHGRAPSQRAGMTLLQGTLQDSESHENRDPESLGWRVAAGYEGGAAARGIAGPKDPGPALKVKRARFEVEAGPLQREAEKC